MSFASFPLDTLGLPRSWIDACANAGLSVAADVLFLSTPDLARKLRSLKHAEIAELVAAVSRAIAPASSTALDLLGADVHSPDKAGSGSGRLNGRASGSSRKGKEKETADDRWIRTGDDEIDALLGGGIRRGVLTELVGESAAGKSHLSMMLALTAAHPHLSSSPGGALILTSERDLPTSRLVDLARSLLARHPVDPPDPTGLRRPTLSVKDMLDNIQATRCADVDALDHALTYLVPAVCKARATRCGALMGRWTVRAGVDAEVDNADGGERSRNGRLPPRGKTQDEPKKPVRLIILDSITALLRGETASTSAGLTQRSRSLCATADRLKALAAEFDLAVVVVNQVSDVIRPVPYANNDDDDGDDGDDGDADAAGVKAAPTATQTRATAIPSTPYPQRSTATQDEGAVPDPPMLYRTQARWFSGQSPGVNKEAALGIVWANAVNTRVMLARTGRRRMLGSDAIRPKRARMGGGAIDADAGADGADDVDTAAPALDPLDGFDGTPDGRTGFMLDDTKATLVRRMHVVFSPFAHAATLDYVITESGVHGVPGSRRLLSLDAALRRRDDAARQAHEADAQTGTGTGERGSAAEGVGPASSEYGDDVFDDLGDLPPEFWTGNFEGAVDEPLAVGVVDFAPPRPVEKE